MKISRLIVLFFLIACSDDDAVTGVTSFQCNQSVEPRDGRLLGMDILDETNTSDFSNNYNLAKEAGINFIHLHLPWTSIETAPNEFEDPGNALTTLNNFVDQEQIKLNLTLRPIDLTGKTVPADLENVRFNSAVMIERFTALLDFVFSKFDHANLTNVQIGNEIDGYDTSNEPASFWSDYGEFLFSVNTYLDQNYPGLKMGFTGTFEGMTSGNLHDLGIFNALADVVDIVGVTYYPQDQNFQVHSPETPIADMDLLAEEFAGHTVYLQEVGYQTSDVNHSSEQKQAAFICNMFLAWDMHKDQFPLMLWVRLNDISQTKAQDLAGPYGLDSEPFIEFLRTLGLQTTSGELKEGYNIFTEETTERGW
ncbi:MAG: hypothetical protein R3345_06240 [Fulvivirga sp.]|nr:hypothetical protein [Fulvivirga sp.]